MDLVGSRSVGGSLSAFFGLAVLVLFILPTVERSGPAGGGGSLSK